MDIHSEKLTALKVKIFAVGSAQDDMIALSKLPYIKGFTTNPSLMHKAGVTHYEEFARSVLSQITDKPISFEVFSDDLQTMEAQARTISSWGSNVYAKIPVTNTHGESTYTVVENLTRDGIKVNLTAVLTLEQVEHTLGAFSGNTPGILSIFAGRIADTGVDPLPLMKEAKVRMASKPQVELLWASSREMYNIFEAESIGADIITVSFDILKKVDMLGRDLTDVSLDTVKTFFADSTASGFSL